MDYKKHYNTLIVRAGKRCLEEYTENHHIIPKCIGGSNDQSNLVRLTPEEHYVAHQLLVKMYPNNPGLVRAAAMMNVKRTNNKLYGWIRRRLSDVISADQSGSGNSQYGTKWITDGINSKKIDKPLSIPKGWYLGRVSKNRYVPKFYNISVCRECKLIEKRKIAEMWYDKYRKSGLSLRKFTEKSEYDKSHIALYKMFKTYIEEY